jgi:hypothetical protein
VLASRCGRCATPLCRGTGDGCWRSHGR